MSSTTRSTLLRSAGAVALAAAFAVPLLLPSTAQAWWRGGWGWRGGVYFAPSIVVGPPVYYAPPPVYYAPPPVAYVARPGAVWIGPAWIGGVFVRGHWR